MTPECLELHRRACVAKERGYTDPDTGLFVQTSYGLRLRGHCCGQGCRHCPFSADVQASAGRPAGAPAWPWPEPKR